LTEHQATAERIREAALRLFATRGFEGTGIRDVAQDAGISTASLYHYIGGKQDLLLDIIRSGMHELRAMSEEAMQAWQTPPERLAALVRGHVMVHGRHQLEALVGDGELRALTEPARKSVIKLRDGYELAWNKVLEDGVAQGLFEIDNLRILRLALVQMCTGVAYWFSSAGELPLAAIADQFADLALAMVRYTGRYPELAPPVTPSHEGATS
jgi:AcrR family transcriptional regulator